MKILGISVGRKMSNTEVLIKEALLGAKECGADVEFIRLHDYKILPCTGCNACVVNLFEKSGTGECTIKNDDFSFIDDKIMECDGLILGSPIYEKTPSGLLKILNDRMGPSHDVAFRLAAKENRKKQGLEQSSGPDERAFKKRAAALIAVGGSEWDNLALPMLHLFALPMQFDVVEKMLVNWVALPGSIVFQEEKLREAHEAGKHVVNTLLHPEQEAVYAGDPGMCPICHSKLLEIRQNDAAYPVVCGICGVKGTLSVENHKVKFLVSEEDRVHSHVLMSGKFEHLAELNERSLHMDFDLQEKIRRLRKYQDISFLDTVTSEA